MNETGQSRVDEAQPSQPQSPVVAPPAPAPPSAPPAEAPIRWRYAADAWRLSSRLTPRRIDLFLRLRSARALPRSFRARFAAMRIPDETIDLALSQVRGLADWMGIWNQTAHAFLSEARREDGAGRWLEAAVARRNAAMCYHTAHFVTDSNPRTVRALRASGIGAFAQAIPKLLPETRRVVFPWRARELPAYFSRPVDAPESMPLVVLLNGATTTKEEMLLWADRFLERGVAVLALDWPGTGEASGEEPLSADCDDITDPLLAFAAAEPGLSPDRVVLCGFSLGGAVAIRSAALDRRIAGVAAVTPPYEPRSWMHYVNPVVQQQLVSLVRDDVLNDAVVESFSLADIMPRLRAPLLVFGAGRDLVVPPEEALHLAAAAGDLGTLVWYPEGAHGLYEYVDDWTGVAAEWIATLLGPAPQAQSTQVEQPRPAPQTPAFANETVARLSD
ncbi:MAG: alpha/beta hydrolase family protein [Thermomicrobiales bacterium]